MKRTATLIAAVIALLGSLGLCMFGTAIVEVIHDLSTWRTADQAPPVTKSLQELPLAVMSAMALVFGLIISAVSISIPNHHLRVSLMYRLLYCSSGVTLMISVVPLAWGIVIARHAFSQFVDVLLPSPDEINAMLNPAEQPLLIGYGILVLSTFFLLAAGISDLSRKATVLSEGVSSGFSRVMTISSATVGIMALCLLISGWFNVNAYVRMITTSATLDPAELGMNIDSILIKSLLVFVLFALLGIFQVLTAVIGRHVGKD